MLAVDEALALETAGGQVEPDPSWLRTEYTEQFTPMACAHAVALRRPPLPSVRDC